MACTLETCKLAFIGGGGNMGSAIITGLLKQGRTSPSNITVSGPSEAMRERMKTKLGVVTVASNEEAVLGADIVVLAIKPQIARAVCEDLAGPLARSRVSRQDGREKSRPLVVSIMGGIVAQSLRTWLTPPDDFEGQAPRVVRVMPNTPARVGEGASGAYASADVDDDERRLVSELLSGFSKVTEWVEVEELLHVVTGLSGSGPAYLFAMVEHLVASATALGLPQDQAERLAKQTCLGAGVMLTEAATECPAQLRNNVTSPGGATEAALKSLHEGGFSDLLDKAVKASANRSKEMADNMG